MNTAAVRTCRDLCDIHPSGVFEEGMIIVFHDHSTDTRSEIPVNDKHSGSSPLGNTYSCWRKGLLVGKRLHHAMILPIYTNGMTELSAMPNRDRYVAIREYANQETAAPAGSKHDIIWAEPHPDHPRPYGEWFRCIDQCRVQLDGPKSFHYNTPAVIISRLVPRYLPIVRKLARDQYFEWGPADEDNDAVEAETKEEEAKGAETSEAEIKVIEWNDTEIKQDSKDDNLKEAEIREEDKSSQRENRKRDRTPDDDESNKRRCLENGRTHQATTRGN